MRPRDSSLLDAKKNHLYHPGILSLNALIDGSEIPFPDKLHALENPNKLTLDLSRSSTLTCGIIYQIKALA